MKTKKFLIIIGILLGFFVCLGIIVAEISKDNNSKTYDAAAQEISIKNVSGIEIAKIKLNTPIINYVMPGKNRLVAEFTIQNLKDYADVFNNLEFYDLNNKNKSISRSFNYKYKAIMGIRDVPIYEKICSKNLDEKNLTELCEWKIKEYVKEDLYGWFNFNEKALLSKGNITIGIFADVLPGDFIEWIPSLYGMKINEWATWTDGLSVDLVSYHQFENNSDIINSGYDFYARDGQINYTAAGLFGHSGSFYGNNMFIGGSGNNVYWDATNQVTLNWWVKETAGGTYFERGGQDGYYIRTDGDNTILFARFGANFDPPECIRPGNNIWYMVTIRKNATDTSAWINGTQCGNAPNEIYAHAQTDIILGGSGVGEPDLNGMMDEMGLWGRGLSDEEIVQLYNGGAGMTWEPHDSEPTIILNFPLNYQNVTINSVEFNCSATDGKQVDNITLFLEGIANSTEYGNTTFLKITRNFTFPEGHYNWSCSAEDSISQRNSSSNFTFTINLAPQISINSPGSSISTAIISININASDYFNISYCSYNITRGSSTEKSDTSINLVNFTESYTLSGQATYRIWVDCNDTFDFHNIVNSSFTYTIPLAGSPGAPGGGGGWWIPETTNVTKTDLCWNYEERFVNIINGTNVDNAIERISTNAQIISDFLLCKSAASIVPIGR